MLFYGSFSLVFAFLLYFLLFPFLFFLSTLDMIRDTERIGPI